MDKLAALDGMASRAWVTCHQPGWDSHPEGVQQSSNRAGTGFQPGWDRLPAGLGQASSRAGTGFQPGWDRLPAGLGQASSRAGTGFQPGWDRLPAGVGQASSLSSAGFQCGWCRLQEWCDRLPACRLQAICRSTPGLPSTTEQARVALQTAFMGSVDRPSASICVHARAELCSLPRPRRALSRRQRA